MTGDLGNLTGDMIQAGEGQANAYTSFLGRHGDGILSIVHEVPSMQALDEEIQRMRSKGVGVLQQVTVLLNQAPTTFTYFDTEPEGKFALGLVHQARGMQPPARPDLVSYFDPVARAASAVWRIVVEIAVP